MCMRSLFTTWLIGLLSLTNISAVNGPVYYQQGESSITFEAYWELVSNTRQTIIQIEAQPEQSTRAQLDTLASQWEAVASVELPDKSVVPIDQSFLVAGLRNESPNLERLKNLLDTLMRAHEQYPQQVFTIQDIEPLREILSRPEFQWREAQASAAPSWLDTLLESIYKFMQRIAFGARNVAYYGRVPLIFAAVILFLFSLFYISRSLSRSLVREAQLAAEQGDSSGTLTSSKAMQRAQTLSGQGDYRNAVRYLYLSSLLILDEQGLLRYDRSRTNREYLRSVSSRPRLAKPLSDVIDVFDRVWYGFESVDEQAYRTYVEHVEELRERQE